MLLYRISHFACDSFPLAALGAYMLLFLVTFATVFFMPPLGIAILFVSLGSLVPVVIAWRCLSMFDSRLALRILTRGECPKCKHRMQTIRDPERAWSCDFCDTRFLPDGTVRSPRMIETTDSV